MKTDGAPERPRTAAAYVRMSTDAQKYSTEHQMYAIDAYARANDIEIVAVYSDEGRSGLSLKNRDALRKLIADITSKVIHFSLVLVYDVSRWGRFQDLDEAAHYEFLCRQCGVEIRYVSEHFSDENTPSSAILKGIKRILAAEYSRDLSKRIYLAQARYTTLGFLANGACPFGFRLASVNADGVILDVRGPGERKRSLQDKTILVQGPPEEVETVRRIFDMYVNQRLRPSEIRDWLRRIGAKQLSGQPFSSFALLNLLKNEKYIGNVIYGQTRSKLGSNPQKTDSSTWVRANGACPQLVDIELFNRAQARMAERRGRISNAAMLEKLKVLLEMHGTLNKALINADPDTPSEKSYRDRFGTLYEAYRQVGFKRFFDYPGGRRHFSAFKRILVGELTAKGSFVRYDSLYRTITTNTGYRFQIGIACRLGRDSSTWKAVIRPGRRDFVALALHDPFESKICGYALLPMSCVSAGPYTIDTSSNGTHASYQVEDLSHLVTTVSKPI